MDVGQAGGVQRVTVQPQTPEPQVEATQKSGEIEQREVTREAVNKQIVSQSESSSRQESRPKVSDDIGRELAKQALERNDSGQEKVSNDGVKGQKRVSF